MRDHPNSRMISHFNKMIRVTNERVEVAKVRYDDLKQEVYKMKEEEMKREEKNKKKKSSSDEPQQGDAISVASSKEEEAEVYSSSEDDYDEDSSDTIGNQCSIELSFDGNSSSITRLSKGISTTHNEDKTNDNDLSNDSI